MTDDELFESLKVLCEYKNKFNDLASRCETLVSIIGDLRRKDCYLNEISEIEKRLNQYIKKIMV